MGGKKKKNSAAVSSSLQPGVPVNPTGEAPESTGMKQQQRLNSEKTAAKDLKTKAPKTYSLNTNTQTDTSSLSDKSILKVVIQPDLEKKVIKLINDYRQEHGDKGPISGRLTSKKLLDLYTALQRFKFKTEYIEEAMKSSVLYGGDLHTALDWLCLNLKDDELPEGFSQKMQEEKQKTRPKFQPSQEDRKQSQTKISDQEEEKPREKSLVKDDGSSMKEWILRYAEQSEDQSSEEEESEGVHKPQLEEKFDPNNSLEDTSTISTSSGSPHLSFPAQLEKLVSAGTKLSHSFTASPRPSPQKRRAPLPPIAERVLRSNRLGQNHPQPTLTPQNQQ